ncbi:MAG: hypothetical protein ACR2MN_04940, partial [Acidimicrobiales bacterium]
LAREAGKWRQKQPPADFTKVGRFYGVWGRTVGFRPQTTITPLDAAVAVEVEARLARWVTWKLAALRKGMPPVTRIGARRPGDGVTAFGLGPDQAAKILRWSQRAAARKQSRGSTGRGGGGAASVDLRLYGPTDRRHRQRPASERRRLALGSATSAPVGAAVEGRASVSSSWVR